jgi:putative flippase GtrA
MGRAPPRDRHQEVKGLRRPAIYILVQCIAYGIDIGSFYVLTHSICPDVLIANVLGKALAGTFAFIAHRHVTFVAQQRESILLQIAKYTAAIIANSILASFLLMMINMVLPNVLISKLISDVISVGLSFFIAKSFVFRPRRTETNP